MSSIAEIFSENQLQALQQDAPTPLYFRLYSLLKNAIHPKMFAQGFFPNANRFAF